MTRGRLWWFVLVAYTALLWAGLLGVPALMTMLPTDYSYSGDEVPLVAVLSSALYTLGPALAGAAFALTAATVAIGVLRTRRAPVAAVVTSDPSRDARDQEDSTDGWAHIIS